MRKNTHSPLWSIDLVHSQNPPDTGNWGKVRPDTSLRQSLQYTGHIISRASIYFNVPNKIASSISNYIHEIQYRRTLYTIANQYKA